MRHPSFSVIFPVHNEASILAKRIELFITKLKDIRLSAQEIILVENGSSDNSWQIISKLKQNHHLIKPIKLPHASYGQAIKAGSIQAQGKIIFIFNIDFFDIKFIPQSLNLLNTSDIVIGSKTLIASQDLRSSFRKLTTYFFNVFLRLILNYPGTDTHGIKAFKNTPLFRFAIHRSRTQNELFDTELIIRMHRWGAVLTELPVTISELRPTRYPWSRRLWLTFIDLISAFWSKYLIPNFSERIVIADDYGRSKAINQAIISAAQSGIVQVISLLPNKVSPVDIRILKRQDKGIRFSAHLNLVQGKPVLLLHKVKSLVDSKGQFWSLPQFLIRLFLGLIDLNQVKQELNQQISRINALGLKISHLDSHQHTHLFPPLWKLTLNLANHWRIRSIRSQISMRQAIKSKPIKYLLHWPIFWLLSLRYGKNPSSPKELDEIVMHPGAAYYD